MQEALYVLLKSSAYSKPLTLLTTRQCELVTGTNSRRWRLSGKGEKYLRQTTLKLRHLVRRTRQNLMIPRESECAWASEVVANVGNIDVFCGNRLAVIFRTCLQAEEKLIPFETRHQTWQCSGCLSCTAKWSDFDASQHVQSRRYSDVQLELCQFGHTNRRPTRTLLAIVDPCDTKASPRLPWCQFYLLALRLGSPQNKRCNPRPIAS